MTREIKFRAWDNDQLKFYYFDLLKIPLIVAFGAPVMQFTGLKDKNGVDIYEGDIIIEPRVLNNDEYVGLIKYDTDLGAFIIEKKQWRV